MKRHIPNALTCANLLCGCIGIVEVFHNNMLISCALIGLAAIFDFLDGFAARLLRVTSDIGKELDSLADVTTFGVLPSILIYQLLMRSIPDISGIWIANFAFLIAVASAVRLAKFNIDPRQTESFIGVPTPANAILIASIPLILNEYEAVATGFIVNTTNLLVFTVLMSYLLVCELPLFALKFKSFGWKGNEIRFAFLVLSILLIVLWGIIAVPISIALYVVISAALHFSKRRS